MDESGFRIGVGRGYTVITLLAKGPVRVTDPGVRDLISDVESISGGGATIPPMLIVPGFYILNKWVQENDLDDDILLATTSSGYSDDVKAYEWIQHFEKHSRKTQVGGWRLLIMDNYGSHLTYEFIEYCNHKNIIWFGLPPHSTYVTQPLDVGIFQPMKHYHSDVIDDAVRLGSDNFNKQDFFAAFTDMRAKAFTRSNILSAFEHTGLIPYSPKMVLDKISGWQPPSKEPTPDPFGSSPSFQGTPHGPKQLFRRGRELQRGLEDFYLPEDRRKKMDQYLKGSLEAANSLALAERDIAATQNHHKQRSKREALDGSLAQKGGVITVGDVRGKIKAWRLEKVAKHNRAKERQERIDANARNKWNKQCAKGFKLIGKKADQWINTWIELLDIEYEDGATFEEVIELFN